MKWATMRRGTPMRILLYFMRVVLCISLDMTGFALNSLHLSLILH